jgi:hypothetical protein
MTVLNFNHASASCKLISTDDSGMWILSSLVSKTPGEGHATALMEFVTGFADAQGYTLLLEVLRFRNPVGLGLDNKQLVEFYKKFDFEVLGVSLRPPVAMRRNSRTLQTL